VECLSATIRPLDLFRAQTSARNGPICDSRYRAFPESAIRNVFGQSESAAEFAGNGGGVACWHWRVYRCWRRTVEFKYRWDGIMMWSTSGRPSSSASRVAVPGLIPPE
jgi:hypothetical protein